MQLVRFVNIGALHRARSKEGGSAMEPARGRNVGMGRRKGPRLRDRLAGALASTDRGRMSPYRGGDALAAERGSGGMRTAIGELVRNEPEGTGRRSWDVSGRIVRARG